jgi:hypothetical protein
MLAARNWAIAGLIDLVKQKPACEVCGRHDDASVMLRAFLGVLDRTGMGPSARLTLNDRREMRPPMSQEELQQEADKLEALAREIRDASRPRALSPHVIDVSAIPDDEHGMDQSPNGIAPSEDK